VLIDSGLVVDRVTIIPEPGANGSVDALFPVTFENFQKVCIATLAAGILESTISGTSNIAGHVIEKGLQRFDLKRYPLTISSSSSVN
jgi:hypothetical protein